MLKGLQVAVAESILRPNKKRLTIKNHLRLPDSAIENNKGALLLLRNRTRRRRRRSIECAALTGMESNTTRNSINTRYNLMEPISCRLSVCRAVYLFKSHKIQSNCRRSSDQMISWIIAITSQYVLLISRAGITHRARLHGLESNFPHKQIVNHSTGYGLLNRQ